MEPKMKLGDYLVAYLKKIGVSHLFGIPGDLAHLQSDRRKLDEAVRAPPNG